MAVGGHVDGEVVIVLSSAGGNIENSAGCSVHHLPQLDELGLLVAALPGQEGFVAAALDGQQRRQRTVLDSLHRLDVKFPSLEVTAGQIERFSVFTAGLRSDAFVRVEIHMSGSEGGAHPVAGGVDDVHELSVRAVQSVPGSHTVEQGTAGVQTCYPTQGSSCEVTHVASSLGAQGAAQHMNIVIADPQLLHQPGDELAGLPADHLGVLAGRVVPGRQGQWLPVHREDVEFSNFEIISPQPLQTEISL